MLRFRFGSTCVLAIAGAWLLSATAAGVEQGRGGRGGAAAGSTSQDVPRDPRDPALTGAAAEPAGTAQIAGTVTVAGTGTPARRARVMLTGGPLRRPRAVISDDQGRFALGGLAAGRYTLTASKTGYVNVTYGQRQPGPGRPGTPIQLADRQQLAVALQLPRGAVISGTVVDEAGEAVPGTLVRVYRYTMQSGVRTLQAGSTDTTDDRGVYRIYGLQPGEYLVCATPRRTAVPGRFLELPDAPPGGRGAALAAVLAAQGADVEDDADAGGYAPVFFPGTTVAASATAIQAGPGDERLGVDFQLQLVPMATIEGTVIAPDGQDVGGVQVRLINTGDEVSGLGNSGARPDSSGRFRITNVAPGHYTLVARTGGGGRGGPVGALLGGRAGRGGPPADGSQPSRLWAFADVAVDGRNTPAVVLTLQPGLTLSGRVEFRDVQPPGDLTRVRVTLTPAETTAAAQELATAATGRVDESGRFSLTGIMPGRYRLSGSAPGLHVESSTIGGEETLDFPAEVLDAQGLTGAVVTFGNSQASLTGVVSDGRNQPVSDYMLILYPTDARYWLPQARRIRAVRPGTDGSYVIDDLPPGDYRLAPVADPEPGSWYDPSFLQAVDPAAMRISVGAGEKKVQNVRLSGL